MLFVGVKNESWDSQTIRMRSGEEMRKARRMNKSKGEREIMYPWSEGKKEETEKEGQEEGNEEEKQRENRGKCLHHDKTGKFKEKRKPGLAQVMRTFGWKDKQELLHRLC